MKHPPPWWLVSRAWQKCLHWVLIFCPTCSHGPCHGLNVIIPSSVPSTWMSSTVEIIQYYSGVSYWGAPLSGARFENVVATIRISIQRNHALYSTVTGSGRLLDWYSKMQWCFKDGKSIRFGRMHKFKSRSRIFSSSHYYYYYFYTEYTAAGGWLLLVILLNFGRLWNFSHLN